MGLFRRARCDGRRHRWGKWNYDATPKYNASISYRSCPCGAIQRHNIETGDVTIWTPDGFNPGAFDQGLTRKIFEELP